MNLPLRTCLGCRRSVARDELVRLAWVEPDAQVVLDPGFRLGGRGCYLHPGCAAEVIRRRTVGRALRRPVDPGQVAELLATLS
ncbi:YlxR family protein [Propionicimonas paludicola]|uniref:YlxR family protein n=1 Tax=Propionicimonas paludicola TaxID=185243 RepID=UPI00147337E6|nr:YlxR family protein [Propionicimonas paludicola]